MEPLPVDAACQRLKETGRVPLLVLAYNVEKSQVEAYIFSDQVPEEVQLVLKKHRLNLNLQPLL